VCAFNHGDDGETNEMTTTAIEIFGDCAPGFEPVKAAFERNFSEHGEVGGAVAVTIDGESKVDLWGGYADKARSRAWERDTIVNVYSTTKGMAALCGHILADRGELDFDAPVTKYWPEFGQAGKEKMPVRYLFSHQAGLPVIDKKLPPGASLDWDMMCAALAEQAPVWEPGTKQGYHTATFGFLVGEVVRRISGKSIGTFLRDEVTGPLNADFLIGFGPEQDFRVADMLQAAPPADMSDLPPIAQAMVDPTSLTARSFSIAPPKPGVDVNHREYRAAESPSGNGHGTARALARIYGALSRGGEVDGVRLLSAAAIERARVEQVGGKDETLLMKTRRSLGYMLPVTEQGDVRGPESFGHAGMGGSLGYADPERKLGFGYVMNQMWTTTLSNPDPRAQGLVAAVHESLGR